MGVLQQVQDALQVAIRNQDAATRTVLKTLIGEAQTRSLRQGVIVDDALIVKLIKDFVKNNNDTLKHRENDALVKENAVLEAFLPKQMDEVALRAAIRDSGATDIGGVMRYLGANYAGLYDGRQASAFAREMLA